MRAAGQRVFGENRVQEAQGRWADGLYGRPGGAELELTHNWDTSSYDLGNGYGHVALAVPDAYAACEAVIAKGGKVTRAAGPMMHGTTVIAFVEDPDGYKIELIQTGASA